MTSRIPDFYRLAPPARLAALAAARALEPSIVAILRGEGLQLPAADVMVENVIGTFSLPNAVAVNFVINGVERVVPMVIEEPSVVAAVSNMARLSRVVGGFLADSDPQRTIGQVQLVQVADPQATAAKIRAAIPALWDVAAAVHPRLVERGGGLRDMVVRTPTYDEPGRPTEHMVVLQFVLDCVDAMGANMVNTIAERLAPDLEVLTGERVGLRILSNLADQRLSRASIRLRPEHLATEGFDGAEVAEGIAAAWRFAWADPYRAATHNKGVMNGIDAVAIATGNDWRAIEAGAHAWCCRDGQYRPMTRWEVEADGSLRGSLELPLQFATVGGPIKVHPTVQANLAVLGSTTARDLAAVAAAVGLAQNLGALKALATEGIQCGHMRMHARTVAVSAGATSEELPAVVAALCSSRDWSVEKARAILDDLR
jgi:hydroxymethylglutaryl-CoA reductase